MKKFKEIILNISEFIMLIYNIFPRNKKMWVTGKTTKWIEGFDAPCFFDNSKYFYLYLANNTDVKVYWLTSSKNEFNKLKAMGINVVLYPSIKGLFITLRAKYFFHHYGKNQINRVFQKGSIQINLWHGTPIKKIMYDVHKINEKNNIFTKLRKKSEIEYVSSTSEYLSTSILERAFNVDNNKMLNFGYPRTDILKCNKEEAEIFCKHYSFELLDYIQICKKFKKTLLYMPTYRDYDPYYFEKADINFSRLNEEMIRNDSVMFIKLHPLTKIKNRKIEFSNIYFIDNNIDIYPFLIFIDYLVTDYSSILFDYLLLNREIIFIPYDLDEYVKSREIYYDYDSITPGMKYKTFNDFINHINEISQLDFSKRREEVKEKYIQNYNFDASKNIYNYFTSLEK